MIARRLRADRVSPGLISVPYRPVWVAEQPLRAGRWAAIRQHGRIALYFAYGTTQQGFMHHPGLGLGERVARVRTAAAHAVVVPRSAACSNPGCRYVHRMAALVPGFGIHAEGDVFEVEHFGAIDALELNGPYVRKRIALVGYEAFASLAAEPELWRALVAGGGADALASYPGYPERLKDCCVRDPDHPPPHDTSDPLTDVRRAPPAPG